MAHAYRAGPRWKPPSLGPCHRAQVMALASGSLHFDEAAKFWAVRVLDSDFTSVEEFLYVGRVARLVRYRPERRW